MMEQTHVIYAPGNPGYVEIEGIDPDMVAIVGVDWSDFLKEKGLNALDESTWHPSAGLLVADGGTAISRRGKSVTPAGPSIITGIYDPTVPASVALAYVYVDPGVIENCSWAEVTNHVRAGNSMHEVTLKILVDQR